MQRVIFFLLMFGCFNLSAQKIVYSESIPEDNSNINFEIIGKVENNYLVYKRVRQKNMLSVFDENMALLDNSKMSFIPERTFNLDFIVYPHHFYIIYQYQKQNTIWCKAVKMSSSGAKLSEPLILDSSRVGLIADKKIYSTIFSEDRKRIMVYKTLRKNDRLTMVTKLYNSELNLLDSNRQLVSFDERREVYTDISIDNSGTMLFAKGYKTGWRENIKDLEVIVREAGKDSFTIFQIPLQGKFVDEVKIRIDNLNRNYILNSLYLNHRNGTIDGLFTAVIESQGLNRVRIAFNLFNDSLRSGINSGGRYATAFDNLFLRNIYVRKDGGFILTAEDYYTQEINNSNIPSRYYNLYNSPYSSDYYVNSPSYNYYYRPYYRNNYRQSHRYFYDDIVILSIDSSLKLTWSNIIHKKQEDADQDNFLSFANVNSGSEIHFLFTDSKKMQVVNNHSVLPGGQIKRYATLKSYEAGYEFMPKLSKQVGARQVIMPCLYRGSVAFAKIDFSD